MPYIDEEILEAKRKQEHQKYTTLETGMYAGDEQACKEFNSVIALKNQVEVVMITMSLIEFNKEKIICIGRK